MILFFCDLDNTLIYSYKHEIGSKKRCVELYQGREISFMTEQTYREVPLRSWMAPLAKIPGIKEMFVKMGVCIIQKQ